jgi:hypothetical protein
MVRKVRGGNEEKGKKKERIKKEKGGGHGEGKKGETYSLRIIRKGF